VDFVDGRLRQGHAYFDLLDELREVLGTEVDLVMIGAVKNRYIAAEMSARSRYSMPRSALAYLADIVMRALDRGFLLGVIRPPISSRTRSARRLSAAPHHWRGRGRAEASIAGTRCVHLAGERHRRVSQCSRHDYASVDDQSVYAIAVGDIPRLRSECEALLSGQTSEPFEQLTAFADQLPALGAPSCALDGSTG